MKTKFLLPVLAMIFAIGMSFTTVNSVDEGDHVYFGNGLWQSIPEQPCTSGEETCQVRDGIDGPIYDVYDEMNLNTKKSSDSKVIYIVDL